MRLPLTLAVIKALLFEVSSRQYAIPISSVIEAVRVSKDSLTTIDGRDALLLRERVIPVIGLRDLFEMAGASDHKQVIIVVNAGGRSIGLRVDRLVGQQELVIKSVEANFTQSDLVAGASILGDGRAILILDAAAVYRKAIEREKKKEVAA
jgi:two-component system chemotaxis sensor kinase CheA